MTNRGKAPLCACGCGEPVKWHRGEWHTYAKRTCVIKRVTAKAEVYAPKRDYPTRTRESWWMTAGRERFTDRCEAEQTRMSATGVWMPFFVQVPNGDLATPKRQPARAYHGDL